MTVILNKEKYIAYGYWNIDWLNVSVLLCSKESWTKRLLQHLVENKQLCVNHISYFTEVGSCSSTWRRGRRRSGAPDGSRNQTHQIHTNTYYTFTFGTRCLSSSHAWFSSAAVKSRRGEPLQWEDTLRTKTNQLLSIVLTKLCLHTFSKGAK